MTNEQPVLSEKRLGREKPSSQSCACLPVYEERRRHLGAALCDRLPSPGQVYFYKVVQMKRFYIPRALVGIFRGFYSNPTPSVLHSPSKGQVAKIQNTRREADACMKTFVLASGWTASCGRYWKIVNLACSSDKLKRCFPLHHHISP